MICAICKEEIKEPIHIEINAIVIKHDSNYVGSINFTPEECRDLKDCIQVHRKCWKNLLGIKSGKTVEIKTMEV